MSLAASGAGVSAVVRAGHLRKLKTMKKKYFVVRGDTPECSARLEYYESEKKFKAGATPRRVIPLKSCYNITRRLDLKQKHVIALFTKEEQFCIVAENEEDLHGWLAAILKLHRTDDASDELLLPIQHVWQVNVQKKGLGATKNIQGFYNLCLTDKTLTLVKIKSHNNVISDLGIPERVEYSLKNIRRCGDSECFFYMEVGRQTVTGAGELWMHSDDANIAQSMHSTIYHAMKNCAKETENERDHIVIPKRSDSTEGSGLTARRSTYDGPKSLRTGLANDKCLCVGSCIRQCVCATQSIDESNAAIAPMAPKHDATTLRSRCDSMPSRTTASFEMERPVAMHADVDGLDTSRDEADSVEWHRTPRIPEEPDFCDSAIRELMSTSLRGSSIQHSRTSSIGIDDPPESFPVPDGYLPMAPHGALAHEGGLVSASSGSVCSGTPSTDPRFSEYQLEPATSHIAEERPPRAYSVGSRPAPRADAVRHRAYSVGARTRPLPPSRQPHAVSSAPLLPRASAEDLMELDFSNNSPSAKVIVSRTPPATSSSWKRGGDEYVDMSWRHPHQGYVEMRPGELPAAPAPAPAVTTPDGYVEMSYGGAARSAPIAVPPAAAGLPLSLGSPADPDLFDDPLDLDLHHPLTTVREISEDGRRSPELPRKTPSPEPTRTTPEFTRSSPEAIPEDPGRMSPEVSCSPSYVKLVYNTSMPIAVNKSPEDDVAGNPMATKVLAREAIDRVSTDSTSCATLVLAGPSGTAARFSLPDAVPTSPPPLNYASLDLEPKKGTAAPAHRTYTQIDFVRSEKLAADGN